MALHFPYKVWLEIDSGALRRNLARMRRRLTPTVKLFAVVKSNAYGHGLLGFSQLVNGAAVDGFCVDSVIEGVKLRRGGIVKPILVLGPTLAGLLPEAEHYRLTLTISQMTTLQQLAGRHPQLPFHLKVDTGMHRQGFYLADLSRTAAFIRQKKLCLAGCYSHLAMPSNRLFSQQQLVTFKSAAALLRPAGENNFLCHLAATGGTLLGKSYHFDLVRIGMGLYGCWPGFEPILSWHTMVTELKKLQPGDCVGYDLTERITRPTTMAILPIGYWHGFDRRLSGIGRVLIGGRPARVLGRVSMDVTAADVTGIPCRVGTRATVLGSAAAMARKIGTSPYEILTRINPLIKKTVL